MKRDEKEQLYHFLDTARCMINGYGRPQPAPVTFTDDPDVRNESIASIDKEIALCKRCPLAETRTFTVPGEGVENPLVLVIGEGPGAEEDSTGHPFVGKAGQLLDKMLAAIDLSRETNTFITNMVKCRPPGNRDPDPEIEVACCRNYLDRQIQVLKPAVLRKRGQRSGVPRSWGCVPAARVVVRFSLPCRWSWR